MGLKYDDEALKRYLLGKSDAEEQAGVEQELIIDADCFEQFMVVKDELFEDYLDEDLSSEDRQAFEECILSTSDGQKELGFARDLQKLASPPPKQEIPITQIVRPGRSIFRRVFDSQLLRIAATVVITLGAVFGVWRTFFYQSELSQGMRYFKKAFNSERSIEARISGLDNYNSMPDVKRGGSQENNIDRISHELAKRHFLQAVEDNPGPASYHALGQFYLADKQFGDAVPLLKKATESDPSNAQLQSDLGAALLEQGKSDQQNGDAGKGTREMAESLDHLNKAVELDGNLLDALFNRALWYQQSNLPQALDAWQNYLKKDSGSKWANEARFRIKAIEDQKKDQSRSLEEQRNDFLAAYHARNHDDAWHLFSQSNNSIGNGIANSLIDSYLENENNGNKEQADLDLEALIYLASLYSSKTTDKFIPSLIGYYSHSNQAQRSLVFQARQFIKAGYERLSQSDFTSAIENYELAEVLFKQSGDETEGLMAECLIGHSNTMSLNLAAAQPRMEELLNIAHDRRYEPLEQYCLYILAYLHSSLGNFSKAKEYSTQALAISIANKNINGEIDSTGQLAEEYRGLKNWDEAMSLMQREVSLAVSIPIEAKDRWTIYTSIGLSLSSVGLDSAAAEYQRAALQTAELTNRPMLISRSHEYLGSVLEKLNSIDEAIKETQQAYAVGETIVKERDRAGTLAHAALQMGHLYRKIGRYDVAIQTYDKSLQWYDSLGFQGKYYEAHKGKLLSYVAKRDDLVTEREIRETMKLLEDYRQRISSEKDRYKFFEEEYGVCIVAIGFEQERMKNDEQALNYSEMCRGRSLLDLVETPDKIRKGDNVVNAGNKAANLSQPLSLAQIQDGMPESSQILQINILEDRVILWLVSKNRIHSFVQNITAHELNEEVQKYLKLLSLDRGVNEEIRQSRIQVAKQLYQRLITPIENSLDASKPVCIVPDGLLYAIPFASLISPESNKYFGESYASLISPSSSLFVRCSDAATKKGGQSAERLLGIGNPAFDRTAFKDFERLSSAEEEINTIGKLYEAPVTLVDTKATTDRVKAEMSNADVIQFATHYVLDEKDPLQSMLLLAKNPSSATDNNGTLKTFEIYQMDLKTTRLVVLSACQTGLDVYHNGEGPVSIARPFIARGVPLVVASLWPVDSGPTAKLMISFHRYRKLEHMSSLQALQRAQTDMLKGSDKRYTSPHYWAGFIAIGGQTQF